MRVSLRQWWAAASREQRRALLRGVATSRNYIYQLTNGHRRASPEYAQRLERVSREINGRRHKPGVIDASPLCDPDR